MIKIPCARQAAKLVEARLVHPPDRWVAAPAGSAEAPVPGIHVQDRDPEVLAGT